MRVSRRTAVRLPSEQLWETDLEANWEPESDNRKWKTQKQVIKCEYKKKELPSHPLVMQKWKVPLDCGVWISVWDQL